MNIQNITIEQDQLRKLLLSESADAAFLYLYMAAGNPVEQAQTDLHLSANQLSCATALLRQLGLYKETKTTFVPGERPSYTENDVLQAVNSDMDFKAISGEVQQLLGKTLNTEELKILLGFNRYLGLPGEVVSVLVSWCKERARQKGSLRNPSLRSIEKEAYYWAEQGVDSMEEAVAFIQNQNMRRSQLAKLMDLLQIRGRTLTPGEEKYANSWLEMGFDEAVLALAYERTCLNTGSLSWAYMNKILTRWQEAGLFTLEQVKSGDRKPMPKGASGELGQAELSAFQRVLQED